jgi:hypothetical protein
VLGEEVSSTLAARSGNSGPVALDESGDAVHSDAHGGTPISIQGGDPVYVPNQDGSLPRPVEHAVDLNRVPRLPASGRMAIGVEPVGYGLKGDVLGP